MVKPFKNKAFDLLKSDVHAAKIGLRPSKTLHYPSLSTQTGTKKRGQQNLKRPATDDRLLTPNPTNKLFQQPLFNCF